MDCTQPLLPIEFDATEQRNHDYVRHGTTNPIAAPNMTTGEVIGDCVPDGNGPAFLAFLKKSVAPHTGREIHVVLDNLSTHTPRRQSLARRQPGHPLLLHPDPPTDWKLVANNTKQIDQHHNVPRFTTAGAQRRFPHTEGSAMTIVFVHGVPETNRLWDPLRARLNENSLALSLPGFGVARPAAFTATKDAYADWLAQRLREISDPIDLVGHDWGALLTLRLATAYDLPLRSWIADVANCFDPHYFWHGAARVWQTPDEGEKAMTAWLEAPAATPRSIAGVLRSHGSPPQLAVSMANALDGTTTQSILDLYRSATPNLHQDWGDTANQPTIAPGLVVVPTADPFNDLRTSREIATKLGAKTLQLPGLSHAWMAQDPDRAAVELTAFWATTRNAR